MSIKPINSVNLVAALLGMGGPLLMGRVGKPRRTEFHCAQCSKEIPPGKADRRCRGCRGLERKAA